MDLVHKIRIKVRQVIAYNLENEAKDYFVGEIELDRSYFGGVRKGKRGRGAAGKIVVFGILKRAGKVFTKIVEDTKPNTLMPIIREKLLPDSVVYTDTHRSYNALDVSEFIHLRLIIQLTSQIIKRIILTVSKSFGIRAKILLRKYNSISK